MHKRQKPRFGVRDREEWLEREIDGVENWLKRLNKRFYRQQPAWRKGMVRHYTAKLKILQEELDNLT